MYQFRASVGYSTWVNYTHLARVLEAKAIQFHTTPQAKRLPQEKTPLHKTQESGTLSADR